VNRCYRRSIEETRKVPSRDKELAALVTDTMMEARELVRHPLHPPAKLSPVATARRHRSPPPPPPPTTMTTSW
jgi:hypothetical protein